MSKKLSKREEVFVARYCSQADQMNGKEAAIAAGYSERTAKQQANQILKRPHVAAEITRRKAKVSRKLEITEEKVLKGLLVEAERTDENSSHGARVTAWKALAAYLGMFDQKEPVSPPQLNVTNNVTIETVEVRVEKATSELKGIFDDVIEGTSAEEPRSVN